MIEAPKPPKHLSALTVVEQAEGAEAEAGASASSHIFGGRANVAVQGSPLPIGYGRLRVGSHVIQASVKSYPGEVEPISTMLGNPDDYKIDQEYGTSRGDGDAQVIRSTTSLGVPRMLLLSVMATGTSSR